MCRAVHERDAFGFSEEVQIVGAVVPQRGDVVALEDVQHLERHEPLRIRRQLVDVVAPISGADRLDPVGAMCREVGHREKPVPLLDVGDESRTYGSAIEHVRTAAGDLLQRPREIGVPEDLARFRGAALGKEDPGRGRILRHPPRAIDPLVRDDLRHRETVARVADRRRKGARQGDGAVLLEQRDPPGERTRHGDRVRALAWHPRHALRNERVGVCARTGPAARIQAAQRLRLRVVHDRQDVTADARHGGLDDREHGSRGHCGIDRVAARLQHLQPGGGGKRLTRGNHAVAGDDGRTRPAFVARGAVTRELRGGECHGGGRHESEDNGMAHVIFQSKSVGVA